MAEISADLFKMKNAGAVTKILVIAISQKRLTADNKYTYCQKELIKTRIAENITN